MKLAFENHISTISKFILLILIFNTSITKVIRLQLRNATKLIIQNRDNIMKIILKNLPSCKRSSALLKPKLHSTSKSINLLTDSKHRSLKEETMLLFVCLITYKYIFIFMATVYVAFELFCCFNTNVKRRIVKNVSYKMIKWRVE